MGVTRYCDIFNEPLKLPFHTNLTEGVVFSEKNGQMTQTNF